ncbi:hypothetical protein EON67_01890 [archaeon]|nr:MAG: hypothetical protein EON67_01890 [archaeon]
MSSTHESSQSASAPVPAPAPRKATLVGSGGGTAESLRGLVCGLLFGLTRYGGAARAQSHASVHARHA